MSEKPISEEWKTNPSTHHAVESAIDRSKDDKPWYPVSLEEFLEGAEPSDLFEQVQQEITKEEMKPKANGGILFPSFDLYPSYKL